MSYDPITPVPSDPLAATYDGELNGNSATGSYLKGTLQKVVNNLHKALVYNLTVPSDLTGLSGVVNGERFFVPGYGHYTYSSASTATEMSPWIINGPSSTGRFVHETLALTNSAERVADNLFALCDSSGLLLSPHPNQIVCNDAINDTTTYNTANSTYVDLVSHTLTVSPAIVSGDIFEIHICGGYSVVAGGGSDTGSIRAAITIGASTYTLAILERTFNESTSGYWSMHALARANTVGAASLKLQGKYTGGGALGTYLSNVSGSIKRYRNRVGSGYIDLV